MLSRTSCRATTTVHTSLRRATMSARQGQTQALLRRLPQAVPPCLRATAYSFSSTAQRYFRESKATLIDILPDADKQDGDTKESEPHYDISEPTPLTNEDYHQKADQFLETVFEQLQAAEETGQFIDVEFSVSRIASSKSHRYSYLLLVANC